VEGSFLGKNKDKENNMEKVLQYGAYRVVVDGEERAQITARHWGDAAATLYYRGSDDEDWAPSPFQVADARHSPIDAVLMINSWLEGNFDQPFLMKGETFKLIALKDEEDEKIGIA